MNKQQKEKYLQLEKRKRIEGIHTIKNKKKEKPFKEKNVPPKEIHTFLEEKGTNTSRKKIPPKFVVPPPVPPGKKWHVVQHKKFPQKLTKTQKRRMQRLTTNEEKVIT